jgi:hypothetical protein
MTAFAMKRGRGLLVLEATRWLAPVLAAGWTLLALDLVLDLFTLPGLAGRVALLATLGVPLLLGAAVIFGRGEARPPLTQSAGWTAILAGALVAGAVLSFQPLLALAAPALLVSALACSRYPVAATAGVFLLTGAYNTIEAYTPLPVGLTVDLLLAGLWAGVVWSYLFGGRDRPVWIWPGVAVIGAYLAITVAGMLGAESVSGGVFAFRGTAWYIAAALLVGYAGWRTVTYHRIARGFVAAAVLVGGYATFRWIVGPAAAEQDLAFATNAKYQFVNNELRLFGSFNDGKALGAWTAAVIPFCVAFALAFTGRWRIPAAAGAGLCLLALLGSEARGAFAGAVVGVLLVLALYQLSRGVPGLHLGITAAAVIGIAAVGVFLFTQTAGSDEASSQRYSALLNPGDDLAYQARLFKWRTALDDIRDKPFGMGLGAAGGAQQRYGRFATVGSSSIDSSYLKIAFEQGFAAMIVFAIGVLLLVAGLARRALVTLDRHRAGLAMGGCGALVAFSVLMYSENSIEGLPALTMWLLVGLGISQFASPARD